MILSDMSDLMSEYPGELCFIIEIGEQPAVNVNKPAGHSKGVDIGRVQQGEGKRGTGDIGFS